MPNESITETVQSSSTEETVFGFKPEKDLSPETINEQLKKHQIETKWKKQDLIRDFHKWTERFHFEFKLKFEEIPAIMIDKIGRSTYGHFKNGHNGFGLRNEVAINETYINEQEYWRALGTLLHELLHVEEAQSGKPSKNNYHNKAFRERAESLGLIVDQCGQTQYSPAPSPFLRILERFGCTIPNLPKIECTQAIRKPGNSKLKLWVCECSPQPVRVRVGIKDFHAKCLKCNAKFKKG